jgi:hypothetical protein
MPAGVTGEAVSGLGAVVVGGLTALSLLGLTAAVAALKSVSAISDRDTDASSVHGLRLTLNWLMVVVGAVTLVAFFFWLRRVVRNADRLGLLRQRFNSGWTVGAWFVPVLNLWRPKQIVNDAWTGSGCGSRTLVDWWWGLYLLSTYIITAIADRLVGNASDSSLSGAYKFMTFSQLLAALAALLGAVMVHKLTQAQHAAMRDEPAASTSATGV